jgi:hypothetical protein
MAYTKLFSSIVTSTIWVETDRTRIVWITMLALADKNGEVQASIPGLARIAGVPVADCEEAVAKFLAPDPYSRTPDDEGRRIEKIDGGWALINHAKYREMASREQSKEAAAKRQNRKRERSRDASRPVTLSHAPSRLVTETLHIAEAEAEADTDSIQPEAQATPAAELLPVETAVLFPFPLDTPEFKAAWGEWVAYRRERRLAALKPRSVIAQLAKLAAFGRDGAIDSIHESIAQNYQGLFPPKGNHLTARTTPLKHGNAF